MSTKVERILARRDGTDKCLKLLRYTALVASHKLADGPRSDLATRLASFESSVGVTRKALRLGRFLPGCTKLFSFATGRKKHTELELALASSQIIYYGLENVIWLVKAGLLDKKVAARVDKTSLTSELAMYVFGICVSALEVRELRVREAEIRRELRELRARDEGGKDGKGAAEEVAALSEELKKVRGAIVTITLDMLADAADAVIAYGDLKDVKRLQTPYVVGAASLFAAVVNLREIWLTTA
mmetsp:Transcript_30600/g.99460  ORF Transcript_30600/g.99460 Transcript_30600/m.99460 type:complete len:243 (-) Transcript_30600:105-833(-)